MKTNYMEACRHLDRSNVVISPRVYLVFVDETIFKESLSF